MIFMIILKNSVKAHKKIKIENEMIREIQIRQLGDSGDLKLKIMKQFIFIVIVYFLFEIFVNGLIPFIRMFTSLFHAARNSATYSDSTILDFTHSSSHAEANPIHVESSSHQTTNPSLATLGANDYYSYNQKFIAINDQAHFHSRLSIIHQYFDFLINMALLYIFRPRKWPQFFNLALFDNLG